MKSLCYENYVNLNKDIHPQMFISLKSKIYFKQDIKNLLLNSLKKIILEYKNLIMNYVSKNKEKPFMNMQNIKTT